MLRDGDFSSSCSDVNDGNDSPEVAYCQALDYSGRDKISPTSMHEAPEFVCHETDEKEAIEPEKSATSRSRALCGLRRRWFFALLAVTVLLFTAAVVGGIVGGMRSRASLDSDTNPNLASVPSQTSTQAMSPSTTSASKPAATANSTMVCTGGTYTEGESRNYGGLCSFTCRYGYCPPGPCSCTSYGEPIKPPPIAPTDGCPLPGEGEGYKGLCSYSCNHGYCPETACRPC